MENETGKAKLFGKIASVMSKVRILEKTGENKYDHYTYVTADAIATRIGAALGEAKVALLPSIIAAETGEYTTQKGGSNFRTVVHMQITLACGESGATWTSDWYGEAIDRSDKSISKAAVSAVKYFLLKTFLLAGGDEEDADASSPTIDDEPVAKVRALLSDEQLETLQTLGRTYYGNAWGKEQVRLSKVASTGTVARIADLMPQEADKLITGLQKKIAEAEAQAAPQTV
jgi:hypothetical protein